MECIATLVPQVSIVEVMGIASKIDDLDLPAPAISIRMDRLIIRLDRKGDS
jgi:hypothetical protein